MVATGLHSGREIPANTQLEIFFAAAAIRASFHFLRLVICQTITAKNSSTVEENISVPLSSSSPKTLSFPKTISDNIDGEGLWRPKTIS